MPEQLDLFTSRSRKVKSPRHKARKKAPKKRTRTGPKKAAKKRKPAKKKKAPGVSSSPAFKRGFRAGIAAANHMRAA